MTGLGHSPTRRRVGVTGLVLAVVGCSARARLPDPDAALIEAERQLQYDAAVRRVFTSQQRLMMVGARLLVANVALCERERRFVGVIAPTRDELNDWYGEGQFWREFREALARTYGIDEQARVIAVIPGSPADEAGLEIGDILYALDRGEDSGTEGATGPWRVRIGRGDRVGSTELPYVAQCDYTVRLLVSDLVDAVTNGRTISVTSGLLGFAEVDDDLAIILGHELAHNLMRHLKRSLLPRSRGSRIRNEREADHLAVYLAARAGYDFARAPMLWRRWAILNPGMISDRFSEAHPGAAERVVRLARSVEEVEDKIRRGVPLVPEGLEDLVTGR